MGLFRKTRNETTQRDMPKSRRVELRWRRPTRADWTMANSELVYSAVSRIANTFGSIQFHLYKGHEIAYDHPLERLLSLEPNPNYSAFRYQQTMEVQRNTEGNAYALKVLDDLHQLKRLDILDSTRVQPAVDPGSGDRWYKVTLDDGSQWDVPGYMIIAVSHLSGNGEKGVRPLDVLKRTLSYDEQVKGSALDQLDGVNHGIILEVPNTSLNPTAGEDVVDRFLDAYEKSNRSVMLLEGGLKASTFDVPAVDSKLLDVDTITRSKLAAVYNIPGYLIGAEPTTLTPEQQQLQLYQQTMLPIVRQYEDEYNRKLLTPQMIREGYRIQADMFSMIRADLGTTANIYQMAVRSSWMKPNEIRMRENLPPDDNGNILMASRDIIPLEIAVQHPEMLLGNTGGRPKEGEDE